MHRSNFWCAVSQYAGQKTAEAFHLGPPHAISYVPVEPDNGGLSSRDNEKVIYTGTLTLKKGVLTLFHAWRIVKHHRPQAELHLFGKDTSYQGQSMAAFLLSQLDEESRLGVHFHGHTQREQLLKELRTARVAVFPSFAEAFAFAPIEAMACGCPTIYSRRTSGPELIRNGIDGILIDPGNAEELADALLQVLSDNDLADRLGRAGHERVAQNFTTRQLLPALEEFYYRCVRQFGSRRRLGGGPLCSLQS
jgi:glycosyltransferase involved in cell wall biosynthesis